MNWPRSAFAPAPRPASRNCSVRCSPRRDKSRSRPCPHREYELKKLPHRTLIVHGRQGQVILLETSLKLAELLDNADLQVFSHCGHWSMIERTRDFNRAVRQFFAG